MHWLDLFALKGEKIKWREDNEAVIKRLEIPTSCFSSITDNVGKIQQKLETKSISMIYSLD